MQILAISGSLRATSSNTALLRAAGVVAPAGVTVVLYGGLAGLPPFNPDLDGEGAMPPPPVAELRRLVGVADALLIASPEYAHGVPGALKNALDWLVSDVAFPGKPVALINARPRATHAQAALTETLRTMSARLVGDAAINVPLASGQLDEFAIVADPSICGSLCTALAAIVRAVEHEKATAGVRAAEEAGLHPSA